MPLKAVWAVAPSCRNHKVPLFWKARGQKFVGHPCVTLQRDCVRADHLGLRLTDASTRAKLSGVRTEDGRPGGFLHVTEP
jgi:hypothetical protein